MYADSIEIEDLLADAVQTAYERERQLFDERAHERSIVFHVARYLAARVEALGREWSVDVDYDRWHRDDIEGLKKRLHGLGGGDGDSDVYPDVIVHHRSGFSAEHNLLVVEVKKQEAVGHGRDREKLRAFMENPFYYQHAAFLILPRDGGCPHLEWIR